MNKLIKTTQKLSQKTIILRYLKKFGFISNEEARREFSFSRGASPSIERLRKERINIDCYLDQHNNALYALNNIPDPKFFKLYTMVNDVGEVLYPSEIKDIDLEKRGLLGKVQLAY